jgi:hypothetical protein
VAKIERRLDGHYHAGFPAKWPRARWLVRDEFEQEHLNSRNRDTISGNRGVRGWCNPPSAGLGVWGHAEKPAFRVTPPAFGILSVQLSPDLPFDKLWLDQIFSRFSFVCQTGLQSCQCRR